MIKNVSETYSVYILCVLWLYLLQTLSWDQGRKSVLEGREELEQGSTPQVQSVLFKSLFLAIEHPWKQLWGLKPLPCPDDSVEFLILSQSQETKPTKQKDSNARFVQVHTCHVFIGMPFDSLKKEKVEGWVVMGWLPSWVAGEKLEEPIKMHASEYCLHLWNFKDIFEVSWVWNMILRWFKFCEPQQNWPINW